MATHIRPKIIWHITGIRWTDTIPEDHEWVRDVQRSESKDKLRKAVNQWCEWQDKRAKGLRPIGVNPLKAWQMKLGRLKAKAAAWWVRDQDFMKAVITFKHDDMGELLRGYLTGGGRRVKKIHLRQASYKRINDIGYFHSRSSRRLLVAHDKVAALVDLSSADHMVLSEISMDPDMAYRSLRGVCNEAQTRVVHIHALYLMGSMDERIVRTVVKRVKKMIKIEMLFPTIEEAQAALDRFKKPYDERDDVVKQLAEDKDLTPQRAGKIIPKIRQRTAGGRNADEVKDVLGELIKQNRPAVVRVLEKYGAAKFSELRKVDYGRVFDDCEALLVNEDLIGNIIT